MAAAASNKGGGRGVGILWEDLHGASLQEQNLREGCTKIMDQYGLLPYRRGGGKGHPGKICKRPLCKSRTFNNLNYTCGPQLATIDANTTKRKKKPQLLTPCHTPTESHFIPLY